MTLQQHNILINIYIYRLNNLYQPRFSDISDEDEAVNQPRNKPEEALNAAVARLNIDVEALREEEEESSD